MTRFARAKGSKASNEKVFADPTPWHEMKNDMLKRKQEIEEEKKRKEAEAKRNENYQKFLKEREEEATNNTEWAEFPEENEKKWNGLSKKSKTIKKQTEELSKRKLKKSAALVLKNIAIDNTKNEADEDNCETSSKAKKKKKLKIVQNSDQKDINTDEEHPRSAKIPKKKTKRHSSGDNVQIDIDNHSSPENDGADSPLEISSKIELEEPVIKKTKVEKKKKIVIPDQDLKKLGKEENERKIKKKKQKNTETEENIKNEVDDNNKKSNKQSCKVIDLDSLPEEVRKKILKKREKRIKQVEKKKLKKQLKGAGGENDSVEKPSIKIKPELIEKGKSEKHLQVNKSNNLNKGEEGKKPKKHKQENRDVKRNNNNKLNKIMVNGNEIELEYFDGFPIKKEDAQNLMKLKKEMISKGLPRSEINRTLKLERRKAEKALAREKKKVCFNCRKFGHNLSECPILTNKEELVDTAGAGICFKCGSSEHTSFACRVVKGQTFKFATCFICKEQGHISRQCPDNAQGLYPKGGSCRVCGDVTHLKRDCPQYQEQQKREEAKYQVDTLLDGNPDDLDSKNEVTKTNRMSRTPKVIKF